MTRVPRTSTTRTTAPSGINLSESLSAGHSSVPRRTMPASRRPPRNFGENGTDLTNQSIGTYTDRGLVLVGELAGPLEKTR